MTRIKVCGMTRKSDIRAALDMGVNALGFILAKSPRRVSLSRAQDLICGLPPFVSRVAVVVNPSQSELEEIIKSRLFDCLQFHGQEDPETLSGLPLRTIKAFSVDSDTSLDKVNLYSEADFYLFDTGSGGTGKTFDWSILKNRQFRRPFILAGGLGANNLEEAIITTGASAVDLNSCIETRPGEKDHTLMASAISAVRNADLKMRSEHND